MSSTGSILKKKPRTPKTRKTLHFNQTTSVMYIPSKHQVKEIEQQGIETENNRKIVGQLIQDIVYWMKEDPKIKMEMKQAIKMVDDQYKEDQRRLKQLKGNKSKFGGTGRITKRTRK